MSVLLLFFQFFLDVLVDFILHHFFRPQKHIPDRLRRGTAMPDDRYTVHAEQRDTAMFRIIHIFENLPCFSSFEPLVTVAIPTFNFSAISR